MQTNTPEALLESFFAAFNRADRAALIELYEPDGALVAQPDAIAQGTSALREALDGFLSMRPKMVREGSKIVVAGDIALALTAWTLQGTGPDGGAIHMNGTSTDVFRRGSDGQWRVVIDNPWGVAIVGRT